mmetsp:Transcript_9843/g.25148  ORF Transcript_9843/g.25148 Transcript_9843/m.25148 type:complete len:128 (+) Transcript_9843:33-416(+)
MGNSHAPHAGGTMQNLDLPDYPEDWKDKHIIKCAYALFDQHDPNDEDSLDVKELPALLRNFTSEMHLFWDCPKVAAEWSDAAAKELTQKYEKSTAKSLTFREFLPLFEEFFIARYKKTIAAAGTAAQ